MPEAATYVFCLVQSRRAPSLKGAPPGVQGAGPLRALAVDRGLWAVVADAPLGRFSPAQLESDLQDIEAVSRHAFAHASIVEFSFRKAPVIPLQLLTLFSDDDSARKHLAGRSTAMRRLFAGLKGLEEWGVRITGALEAPGSGRASSPASGRDYLQDKKRLQDRKVSASRATVREVESALKTVGTLAAKSRKEVFPPPGRGRPFVAGASFLVNAKRRGLWKKQIEKVSAALAKRGHRLDVTGPWPPYHFAAAAARGKRGRGTR